MLKGQHVINTVAVHYTHTFPTERRYMTIPNDHQSTAMLYGCPDSISGAVIEIHVAGFELYNVLREKCSDRSIHNKYTHPYMVLFHK